MNKIFSLDRQKLHEEFEDMMDEIYLTYFVPRHSTNVPISHRDERELNQQSSGVAQSHNIPGDKSVHYQRGATCNGLPRKR